MRTWERVTFVAKCGRCAAVLGDGMLMQRLQLPNLRRRLVFCENCAEGEAPPDLPANPVRHNTTERMQSVAKMAQSREWLPHPDD